MTSSDRTARLAGSLYVVLAATGAFSILYVPSQLVVWADPSATVGNIIDSELLFRSGIISGLISNVLFLLLPLVLYALLEPVNTTMARLMVLFAIVSVPVTLVAPGNLFDVLALLDPSGVDYTSMLTAEQLQARAMSSLEAYSHTTFVATIFWGLWLFPFGYLVFNSGFLPKILGVLLMAGCFGYLIDFLGLSLWPATYRATGISTFIHLPSGIGEIGIAFWPLIMGARKTPTDRHGA